MKQREKVLGCFSLISIFIPLLKKYANEVETSQKLLRTARFSVLFQFYFRTCANLTYTI